MPSWSRKQLICGASSLSESLFLSTQGSPVRLKVPHASIYPVTLLQFMRVVELKKSPISSLYSPSFHFNFLPVFSSLLDGFYNLARPDYSGSSHPCLVLLFHPSVLYTYGQTIAVLSVLAPFSNSEYQAAAVVLPAMIMESSIFRDVIPGSLVYISRHFGGICFLYL